MKFFMMYGVRSEVLETKKDLPVILQLELQERKIRHGET